MPQEWNNIWVVTQDELVPKFYTEDSLRQSIVRFSNKPYGIKKVQSGGNGRKMLIAFDSLDKHIQDAIGDPRKLHHIMEMFYSVDSEAVRFFTSAIEGIGYLKLVQQEEYITNASVLKAALLLKSARENERRTKGGSMKGILPSICADITSFNNVLEKRHNVKHTLPSSERWLKDALKAFAKPYNNGFNYPSLISGKLRNTNAQKVTDEVVNLLNNMFAGTMKKPTRTEVAKQFDAFLGGYLSVVKDDQTGEMYDPSDFKKLSESTIINYLGKWDEKIGTYAKRSGDRQKLMGLFKPYHSLERPKFAGSIISVDDRQPPFAYAPGQRAWFYNAIDLASGAFTCWVYGKTKEGLILDFYRQIVRNYTQWGICLPAEIEAEASLNSNYTQTFLRPGALFDHVRIEANNARGKRIEAYYRQLRYTYEKDREGWLARPHALSESNQKGADATPIIPYNTIIQNSLRDIENWNNAPHAVEKHITCWEYFIQNQHPALKPTNWKAILPYLGYKETTSVNAGIIKLQHKEFLLGDEGQVYVGEKLINLMKQVEGREVTAYWLDGNEGEVLKVVLFLGDVCVCEAIPKPTYSRATIERTPEAEHARELMSSYVATIEGFMRLKKSLIDPVIIIDEREKTLNRRFVIPEVQKYEPAEEEVEVLPPIEDGEDDELIPITTNKPSFKDRF